MKYSKLDALGTAVSGEHLRRSLIVMFVVGTLLNIINQGDVLIEGAKLDMYKLGLTYCMPFLVVTFGVWSTLCKAR